MTSHRAETGTWQKTACILCECNCGLEVLVEDRQLLKIRGDKDHPQSQGYTCEKPLRLNRYQNGADRIDTPMRRRADGSYEPIDWETALDEIASRLRRIQGEHGGETIAFYGGGGQGNHLGGAYGRSLMNALGVQYYSNALAQEKIGEGWVDSLLYGNHTSGDFEHSEVAVFVGKNPWQSHGVARARPVLREIARDLARTMIVIDPRRSETAEIADLHLQVRPGTDVWCVGALAAILVQEDLVDRAWLAEHTIGSEPVLGALRGIDVARYAEHCGVDEQLLRTAARRIGTAASVATYEDLGVQQSPNSALVSYLQKMLWILTGSFAKPGGVHIHSWLFPLAGTWHPVDGPRRTIRAARGRRAAGRLAMRAGARPLRAAIAASAGHAGAARLANAAATLALDTFFEAVAVDVAGDIAERLAIRHAPDRTPVTNAPILSGLMPAASLADEILSDHPERLRALWVEASNPVHSLPGSARLREAFEALDLSVVIDVAMSETARCADYVLPASSQFEKWEVSLFTLHFPHNTCQLRAPLMDPLPGTRAEPAIYAEVIDRLGVVDPALLDDLRAAARVGPESFALTFFSTVQAEPALRGLTTYLLYRTLGETLGEGDEAVAALWGMAQLTAIAHPDAVARAGFTGRGFAQGQQLFEAIRTRREGVTFSEDEYDDAWGYVQHEDGRFHLEIPELLAELAEIDRTPPPTPSAEFPFVLSAGERRSFTANVIIRNPEWRRRDASGALRMSPGDAEALGVGSGDVVRIVTAAGSALTEVDVTDIMQRGHISLPNGMGVSYPGADGGERTVGVALNELTSTTNVDKFWRTPLHKHVPARVELVAAPGSGP